MPRAFTDLERQRIRARLLDAAREAMGRGGLRRSSVERLTASVGISKGAFYLFFESKEALLVALLEETEAALRAELERVVAATAGAPREERLPALRPFLRALFAGVAQHPYLLALADPEEWAWILRSLPPERLAEARRDDDRWFASLLARIGPFPGVDPVVLAGLAPAALALAHGRPLIGEDRYDAVIALVVEGLAARLEETMLPERASEMD